MKRGSVFRSITAALLVTAAAISVYHRHGAGWWGRDLFARRGAADCPGAEIFWARADALGRGLPAQPALDEVVQPGPAALLRWSGAGLGTVFLVLALWIFRTIGKNITSTVETREEHELVTDGPYRWVRHPLYTVGTSFFTSLGIVAANWFVGLVMLLIRLPKEEEKLIERFGDEYRAYMERTGRLLPRTERD